MALKDISLVELTQAIRRLWGSESLEVDKGIKHIVLSGRTRGDGRGARALNCSLLSSDGVGLVFVPFSDGGIFHTVIWNSLGVGSSITIEILSYEGVAATVTLSASQAGQWTPDIDCKAVTVTLSAAGALSDVVVIGEW